MKNIKKDQQDTIRKIKGYNKALKSVIIKYKDGRKQRETLVDFNQPCCMLMRTSMKIDFLEANKKNGLLSGIFKYIHSNGKDYEINLTGCPLYKIPYGKSEILAYVHHEDWPTPLNNFFSNPHITIDDFNSKIEHSFSAANKWEAAKIRAKSLNIKYLAVVIAALALFMVLYFMFRPDPTPVQTVIENVSILGK